MSRKGFAPIIILLVVAIILIAGGVWYYFAYKSQPPVPVSQVSPGVQPTSTASASSTPSANTSAAPQGQTFSTTFSEPYPFSWKEQNGQLTYSIIGATLGSYPGDKLSASYGPGDMVHAIALAVRIDVGQVLATTDIRLVGIDGSLQAPDSPQPYMGKQGGGVGPWNTTLTSDIVFIVPLGENDFTFAVPSVAAVGGFDYFRVYLNGGSLMVGPPRG